MSFSGGKDSTVLAYLVADALNELGATCPLHLAFCDTGLEYPENREFVTFYVDWLRKRFPAVAVELHILKPEMNFKEVLRHYGYPVVSKEVSHVVKDARSCPGGKVWQRFFDNNNTSMIDWRKYAYLLDAPFKISHQCCDVMKKRPSKRFEKETGLHPMSAPMSFWKEQDVLAFIRKYGIPLSAVYGEIVEEDGALKTTGVERSGCMYCALGAHRDDRFIRLAKTHPKQYAWIMKPGGSEILTQRVNENTHIPSPVPNVPNIPNHPPLHKNTGDLHIQAACILIHPLPRTPSAPLARDA